MLYTFIKKYLTFILISTITILASWNMHLSFAVPLGIAPLKAQVKGLQGKNSKLLAQNNKLRAKQKVIRKTIKKHRKERVQKLLTRVKRKIASGPAKAVPFLGVAAIITMTLSDVEGYCKDIDDVNTLEASLFEDVEDIDKSDIEKLCDTKDIEKTLTPMVQAKFNDSKDWIKEKSNASMEWVDESYTGSIEWIKDVSDSTKTQFSSLIDEKEVNESTFYFKVLRNLSYARYGYSFKNKELMKFFKSQEWYKENLSYKAKLSDLTKREFEWRNKIIEYEDMGDIDKENFLGLLGEHKYYYYVEHEKPLFEKKRAKEIFNYLKSKGIHAKYLNKIPNNGIEVVWNDIIELKDIDLILTENPKILEKLKKTSKLSVKFEYYPMGSTIVLTF